MKRILAIGMLATAMSIGMAGCAQNFGQDTIRDESKVSQIKVGKSTTKDVEALLGTPNSTQRMGNELTWTYVSTNVHANAYVPFLNMAGNTMDSQNLTVTFDGRGLVKAVDKGQTHN